MEKHSHPFMPRFSPETDTVIARQYSAKTLEAKRENKTALQEELGWPEEPGRMLICLPAGMTDALGGALLKEMMDGLLTLPVQMVVLGKGATVYGKLFTDLAAAHPHRIAIVTATEEAQRTMYAAADVALFCSDASSMPELADALRYGVVPVAPEAALLADYQPNQESGNAFLFSTQNPWAVFAAVVRATETYRFPFDWRTIQRHCMDTANAPTLVQK